MGRPGAEVFDERITYEEVAAVLRAEKDLRSTFLADALVAGIEAYRRGYVMIPDVDVSNMWTACWNVALEIAPMLRFQKASPKPGLSTWLYFRKADGFSKDDLKRAEIVYKAGRGQVDLQFSGTAAGALARRAEGILDSTMKVVQANKSASIRIFVPEIDFRGSANTQEAAITEGFKACERLRMLFVEHRARLLELQTPRPNDSDGDVS